MPWSTENGKEYWMPEVLPEPTEEYQQEQSEKLYLTREGKERRHPGWTYAENVAYVDDEYLFQNEGWKLVVDEVPVEPVTNKVHQTRNKPDQWEEIDERTVKVTYSISGFIPEVLPEATQAYQQNQLKKKYLTPEDNEINHPKLSYSLTGAYVDDEYLFQNEGWKLVVDEVPVEPVTSRIHQTRNTPDLWEEIDEKIVKVTYSISGFIPTTLPRVTQNYQQNQLNKKYLTPEDIEVNHPKWSYVKNGAYVDDEYLFQNQGWRLIVDEVPLEPVTNKVHQTRNTPNLWEEIGERTVEVTYSISGFIPEVLPEATQSYQQNQLKKKYLTPENIEVSHPRWSYVETGAYVNDEYLFQNEGWKLVVDEVPVEPVLGTTHNIRNTSDLWEEIDTKTVEVTYTFTGWTPSIFPEKTNTHQQTQSENIYINENGQKVYHPMWSYVETGAYVDDEYLFQNEGWKVVVDDGGPDDYLKHKEKNPLNQWDYTDEKTVKVTYTITDFTEEEVEAFKENKWENLRGKRDGLLGATDWIIVRALEENLTVSSQVTLYRQQLRNFPDTIIDILDFNIDDDTLWPTKPEVYFEV
jgi:hypothetical protein